MERPTGGFTFDLCARNAMLEAQMGSKLPQFQKTGTTISGLIFKDGVVLGERKAAAKMERPTGGFTFDLCARNAMLEAQMGSKLPQFQKTGTTISGLIFKDGVVLGADTRATSGPIVADKNCEKLHYMAPNIYCAGAGTSADCDHTTGMMASNLALHRMNTGREVRVVTAVTMIQQMLFRYQGHIGAALILGGVDFTGPQLYSIHPHGSTDKLPYLAMGSGSLAAISVLESSYRENMEEEEAVALMRQAIAAGIFNDLGSGSNCDITVIKKGEVKRFRNIDKAEPKYRSKAGSFKFARGNTAFLNEKVRNLKSSLVVTDGDAMET
eukprot:CAMPEP_0114555100 /NCGR_PEP_ID=MMETSP0114-20121206/8571_1 /TAXON_ID=31324 /ORGANISM="Goniomonas sp, Strain m" /LENGTH=324 /DNA_ID=CAMNT_0001740207 /DNA_START=45 /DNA_END=1018 /DNA_ORIENTATION=+